MQKSRRAHFTASTSSDTPQSLGLKTLGFNARQIHQLWHMFDTNDTCSRIVLVSGQSGSGKSTTVKNLAEYLLECQANLNIVAVEYNPEYHINGVTQISVANIADYAQVISSAASLDPDVVVVGEIRDAATALAVLRLAESGYTVITSICAAKSEYEYSSVAWAIERFALLTGKMEIYVRTLLLGCLYQELSQENDQFHLTVAIENYASSYSKSANIHRMITMLEHLTTSKELSDADIAVIQNILSAKDQTLMSAILSNSEPCPHIQDKRMDPRVKHLQIFGFSEAGALFIARGFDDIFKKDTSDVREILEQLATSRNLVANDTELLNRVLADENLGAIDPDVKENCGYIRSNYLTDFGFSEHGAQAIAEMLNRFAES
jgi:ABC-type dipeptide/oligopeptide/nickel transport system ATPase subunit